MVIFPLAPDQTIAQMWSNGARGGWQPQIPTVPSTQTGYHMSHCTGTNNNGAYKVSQVSDYVTTVWNETWSQRRPGAVVVVVVVTAESPPPPFTGSTSVANRIMSITMPIMRIATRTQITVQRVLRHHILRRTRWDVFLNVAAFTPNTTGCYTLSMGQYTQWSQNTAKILFVCFLVVLC